MGTQDLFLRRMHSWPARQKEAEREQTARYGPRYALYRQQYELAGRFEYEPPFPLYLMLEQTYSCNLRCPMCIQGLPVERANFTPTERQMSWELFQRVVLEGEQHGCPSIALHVNDEPLLVEDLPERIALAKEHGFMDVFMTTNGVLFTEDKVRQVVDAGVTHILFSVDAATEETYAKVRIGGDYEKVLNAAEMVRRYRESRDSALPLVRASFLQSRLNQHETSSFVEKFSKLVDYVEIQGFTHYYDKTVDLVPQGAECATNFTCNEPWRNLIVRADGTVIPCCAFYGYEIVVGNALSSSLAELFNSPQLKTLRSDFRQGIYRNPACESCSQSFYEPVL